MASDIKIKVRSARGFFLRPDGANRLGPSPREWMELTLVDGWLALGHCMWKRENLTEALSSFLTAETLVCVPRWPSAP